MKWRERRLIDDVIKKLQLDLSDLIILTEVGSSNYLYTPIIALAAGAKRVFAWSRDSKFGMGSDIVKQCFEVCQEFGLPIERLECSINERPPSHVSQADIITNLGFVRPLNKELLTNAKNKVVIPYMCEAWEFRQGDVDLEFCRQRSIKIAGTWESHPSLKIFDGCEHLIAKLCFEAGFEIYQNKILIISQDNFGRLAESIFKKLDCKQVDIISPHDLEKRQFDDYDFLFLADYETDKNFFSEVFFETNFISGISLIHLCGHLDLSLLESRSFKVYPNQNGFAKRMTRTLDYLGPKPVLELHAAGLKVGENLFKGIESDLVQMI